MPPGRPSPWRPTNFGRQLPLHVRHRGRTLHRTRDHYTPYGHQRAAATALDGLSRGVLVNARWWAYAPRTMSECRKTTIRTLQARKREGRKITMLTCYDYMTARILEEAQVDSLLVGDTYGEVVLGHASTLPVTVDHLVTVTAAVRRGAPSVFLVGDMPYLSYQVTPEEAIRNAGRFMAEAGPLDDAGAQVFFDPPHGGRQNHIKGFHLELLPVFYMGDPGTHQGKGLPRGNPCHVTHHHNGFSGTMNLNPGNGIMIFFVAKGDSRQGAFNGDHGKKSLLIIFNHKPGSGHEIRNHMIRRLSHGVKCLQCLFTITGFHQHSCAAPGIAGTQDVFGTVPHHAAGFKVDIIFFPGL